LLFGPDVVVVFVVVTGGGAGLSAGMKPWLRTSWSSSASGRCRRLGGEAWWRLDEAVCRAAHPVMRALRPPAAARQSHRPSSSPWSASVEDTDDDGDDVDDGGGGLWQRGQRDPVAVLVVVIVDNDSDDGDKRIVEAEQRGRTTKDVVSPTLLSAARFVISLSSSCDHQHFRRQPPSPIANLRQPLSYPSPSPLLSMVGCCVPHPPSSIPTEPPS